MVTGSFYDSFIQEFQKAVYALRTLFPQEAPLSMRSEITNANRETKLTLGKKTRGAEKRGNLSRNVRYTFIVKSPQREKPSFSLQEISLKGPS